MPLLDRNSIDEPLSVLALLYGSFVLFAHVFDGVLGTLTPVVALLSSFTAVTLLIAVVKYRG